MILRLFVQSLQMSPDRILIANWQFRAILRYEKMQKMIAASVDCQSYDI